MPPHSGAVTAMILVFPSERVDLGLFRVTLPSLGVLLFPPCERRGSVADCLDVVGEAFVITGLGLGRLDALFQQGAEATVVGSRAEGVCGHAMILDISSAWGRQGRSPPWQDVAAVAAELAPTGALDRHRLRPSGLVPPCPLTHGYF